jgi:DNA-directed RNA polymerase specialized sigma24 family protein
MQRDLVIRAQRGDHAAFSVLATEVIGGLHRTARLILRDVELANDAVQDALVTAWLDIRGVQDADRFEAWLNRLLVRACYKVARRTRRRRLTEVALLPEDAPTVPDGGGLLALRDQLERGFAACRPSSGPSSSSTTTWV